MKIKKKKDCLVADTRLQADGRAGGLTCSPRNDFFLKLRKERLKARRTFETLQHKRTVFCALSQ